MARQTIRTYIYLMVLRSLGIGLIMPIYVLFLEKRGMDDLERNIVNSVFFITCLICELPTGALADTWGRKKSFILSCLISAIALFTYARSSSLPEFMFAEVLSAIGSTMANGAFFAWLTHRLIDLNHPEASGTIQRKAYTTTCLVSVIASLVGGWLGTMGLWIPWICGGCMFLATSILALFFMKEEERHPQGTSFRQKARLFFLTTKSGALYAITHPTILLILGITFVLAISVQGPNMQWPVFFKSLFHQYNIGDITSFTKTLQETKEIQYVSYLWTGVQLSLAFGGWLGRFVEARQISEKWPLVGSLIITGLGIILTVLVSPFFLTVGVFFMHEVARGFQKPLSDGYLNKQVKNESERATVLSVGSLPLHIASIIGLLASGISAKNTSIGLTWVIAGCIPIIGAFALAKFARSRPH